MNKDILTPYKDCHVLAIIQGDIDVPEDVYDLVCDMTQHTDEADLTHVLVLALI